MELRRRKANQDSFGDISAIASRMDAFGNPDPSDMPRIKEIAALQDRSVDDVVMELRRRKANQDNLRNQVGSL